MHDQALISQHPRDLLLLVEEVDHATELFLGLCFPSRHLPSKLLRIGGISTHGSPFLARALQVLRPRLLQNADCIHDRRQQVIHAAEAKNIGQLPHRVPQLPTKTDRRVEQRARILAAKANDSRLITRDCRSRSNNHRTTSVEEAIIAKLTAHPMSHSSRYLGCYHCSYLAAISAGISVKAQHTKLIQKHSK